MAARVRSDGRAAWRNGQPRMVRSVSSVEIAETLASEPSCSSSKVNPLRVTDPPVKLSRAVGTPFCWDASAANARTGRKGISLDRDVSIQEGKRSARAESVPTQPIRAVVDEGDGRSSRGRGDHRQQVVARSNQKTPRQGGGE